MFQIHRTLEKITYNIYISTQEKTRSSSSKKCQFTQMSLSFLDAIFSWLPGKKVDKGKFDTSELTLGAEYFLVHPKEKKKFDSKIVNSKKLVSSSTQTIHSNFKRKTTEEVMTVPIDYPLEPYNTEKPPVRENTSKNETKQATESNNHNSKTTDYADDRPSFIFQSNKKLATVRKKRNNNTKKE